MRHNAHALPTFRSRTDGLWRALCDCGWRAEADSKPDAERIAKVHNWAVPAERRVVNALDIVHELPCFCGLDYEPDGMEWSPDQKPCVRCRLGTAAGVVVGEAA